MSIGNSDVPPETVPSADASHYLEEAQNTLKAIIAARPVRSERRLQVQQDRVLEEILRQITTACESLRHMEDIYMGANSEDEDMESVNDEDMESVNAQRKNINDAEATLDTTANSLKPFSETPEKEYVVEQWQKLEVLVSSWRSQLPEDRGPLFYDSGMYSISRSSSQD